MSGVSGAASTLKGLAKGLAWALARLAFGAWGLWRRAGMPHRRRPRLGEARSILAIRMDLLGDVVFTLPAIEALKEAAPGARVTVLALPYTVGLLKGHPSIDRIVAVDVNRWRRPSAWLDGSAVHELRRALGELRAERFDLCVSFYGRVAAAAALLSGADYLVGYRSEGYICSFDRPVPGRRYDRRQHESEYCLDLVRAVGVAAAARQPRLPVHGEAARNVETLLTEAGIGPGDELAVLHPGALNMVEKRWLPDRWAVVADRLQESFGMRVVLVGSAAEAVLAGEVQRSMETPVVNLAGRTRLDELVALLGRARLFLGGDSGPLHVASALGVPSVSVYGPTDPAHTGPLHPRARVVQSTACVPCYQPGGGAKRCQGAAECMAGVSVDEVWETVRASLAG